jgi:hypothetical protein
MLKQRSPRPAHRWSSLALCLLLAGCSGTTGPANPTATSTGAPSTPSDPGSTPEVPTATTSPQDLPLPTPNLDSIDEILTAMDDPEQSEQVVVSLLAQLGIGLYTSDGAPIRKGTEASDADLVAFEPTARGLAEMLRERNDPEQRISFADFHAAIATGGYAGSVEDLASAYTSAYAGEPDALISRVIRALGPIDAAGKLPEIQAWLLLLDGFVAPHAATSAVAMAGDGWPAVAAGGGRWGVARPSMHGVGALSPDAWWAGVVQLKAVLMAWRIVATVSPAAVHEGHGRLGEPTTIKAELKGPRSPLTSPFTGATVLPSPAGAEGVDVGWVGTSTLEKHGTIDSPVTQVDTSGSATTTYTPRQEAADGKGIDLEEPAGINAGVFQRDLAYQLYGEFALPYAAYFGGIFKGYTFVYIGWHEKAEAAIKIVWTDFYDGVEDRITFLGDLTDVEGDPANGGMFTGTGTATGSRAGWAACNPGIDVVPSGTVTATFNGILSGPGRITVSAYADVFSELSGISTAPIEVPLDGSQRGIYTSSEVGDLCPHSSDGELTLTNLSLP